MKANQTVSKIIVFYRDMPEILDLTIKKDGNISMVKDGIKEYENRRCPRMTLTMAPNGAMLQDKRILSFIRLLENLEKNNQIAGFSIIK